MNYYEPKYLRGVIEQALPIRQFFRTRFFSERILFPTETVSFEFTNTKRRLLPFVNAHSGSVPMEREGYQLKTFRPPLLSGSKIISRETLESKLPGEPEWNGYSPEERAKELAIRDLNELQTSLFRREEYMCARVKQDGKIAVKGYGLEDEIDYGFENISDESSSQWTENFNIFGKLQEKSVKLMQAGITPDMLILGYKAAVALQTNKDFLKLRRDSLIQVNQSEAQNRDGGNYICTMLLPGLYLNVYQYLEQYYDEDEEVNKPLIDDGTAILQSSQERNYMLYGAVSYIGEDDEYVSAAGSYNPYVVTEKDPPLKKLILSSRPLPMPVDIESWYVMKNVA